MTTESIIPRKATRSTSWREAYIAAHRPLRWFAKHMRAGKHDRRLRAVLFALKDSMRSMEAIVANLDEATVAFIMRTTPNLERTDAVADALLTTVRVGRRDK